MSQQIDRTLDVLELLIEAVDGLPLGEIAEQLRLPKSAAHRLVTRLVERGYMEQDAASQRYRLSMRMTVLGFRYLSQTGLTDICQPELDDLARRTGELARVAMADGDTMTWVAQAQGARYGLRYDGNLGRHVVLPATAVGKVWLSTLTDEEAAAIVLAQGFGDPREVGPRAVTSIADLLEQLAITRERGYGFAWEEGEPGMAAVAAVIPARTRDGRCVGTVSVAGPTVRQTKESVHALADDVKAVAARLAELWPIRLSQPEAPVPKSFETIGQGA